MGASTLRVVDELKTALPDIQSRLTYSDINLQLVMDQSVYVRNAINALAQEGILGAILCSLVILVFLGEWRMTLIAILTIPVAVLTAVIGLYYPTTPQRDDAGRAVLAIGPWWTARSSAWRTRTVTWAGGAPARGGLLRRPARSPCPSWSPPAARCWSSRRSP